jgi:hypothetical protein
LGSLRFNNNKLMEGIKMWVNSQAAYFSDTSIQKLNSPIRPSASIPAVTTLKSGLSTYFFLYNVFFSFFVLLTAHHFPDNHSIVLSVYMQQTYFLTDTCLWAEQIGINTHKTYAQVCSNTG